MKSSSPTNNFSLKKIKNYAQFFFFLFSLFWTYLLLYSQLPSTRSQITCHLPFSFFPYQNHLQFGSFYKNFSFFFIHHSPILQSLFLLLLIWWPLRVWTMCAIGWGNLKICLNFYVITWPLLVLPHILWLFWSNQIKTKPKKWSKYCWLKWKPGTKCSN